MTDTFHWLHRHPTGHKSLNERRRLFALLSSEEIILFHLLSSSPCSLITSADDIFSFDTSIYFLPLQDPSPILCKSSIMLHNKKFNKILSFERHLNVCLINGNVIWTHIPVLNKPINSLNTVALFLIGLCWTCWLFVLHIHDMFPKLLYSEVKLIDWIVKLSETNRHS